MRLIDADKLYCRCKYNGSCYSNGCEECRDYVITKKEIDEQPTVEIPNIELLQDGTLVVNTDLYFEVNRVLVEHETNGTLYYSDGDERPKGKWEKYCHPMAGDQHYICTCCNEYQNFGKYGEYYVKAFKFCPNCGAEMEIGE